MKKVFLKISSLLVAVLLLCAGLAGCSLDDLFGNGPSLPKLSKPEVVIDTNGLAKWGEVKHAILYNYVIDDGEVVCIAEQSVQLEENQTIKVQAVSGSEDYVNSDYSVPKTYRKGNGDGDGDGDGGDGHKHTDVNADGRCDECGDSIMAELTFYAVNDLHGKYLDTSNQPGVDEFTTYLKNLYADTEREEILLSSGDMWQGTVESSSNKGLLMTDWMNEVGFVSMSLGNHEYDWGGANIQSVSERAKFPFLAINVTDRNVTTSYCQASTVVEKAGVKVGIIGAIGDCLSSISGDFTSGLSFATGSYLTSLVKSEATRLRAEGCDFIVYSLHDGGTGFSSSSINSVTNSDMSWYDTALSNGYVDLVFEAHTHQRYILQDEYGVYHLQGGGENSYISSAEVSFNKIPCEYTVRPKLISNSVYGDSMIEGDSMVQEIFERYFPTSNPYDSIGSNRAYRKSKEICDKVAELYYRKGIEEWGSQYDIVLGGGFLKARSPYNLSSGKVTYADLFSILPFDNDIVLGKIKGSDLIARFLNADDYECTNSQHKNYHIYATISVSEVESNKIYYVIVDSYSSTYRSNNITEVARLGGGIYARDLLAEFVRAGGWN